nr:MAG: hypothetical protein DIU67_08240 [Actinomycetota bacterium]
MAVTIARWGRAGSESSGEITRRHPVMARPGSRRMAPEEPPEPVTAKLRSALVEVVPLATVSQVGEPLY